MSQKVITYPEIKPAESCKYDGVSLGEVMMRLDPYDVPTARARLFRVSQGGGETNVACGISYTFGLRSAVLTALVNDNIGINIRNQMREAGVDTSNICWFNTANDGSAHSTDQKGTLMNGLNFTYNGKGIIPSDTAYYRAHSAVRQLSPGDFNWDKIFGEDEFYPFKIEPSPTKFDVYHIMKPSDSYVYVPPIKGSGVQLLKNTPRAIVNVMLRPFPTDNGSFFKYFVFAENILFLAFLIFSFLNKRKLTKEDRSWLFYLISGALILILIIGWTTPILGAIARYKMAPQLLLLIAAFITLNYTKKIKT